MTMPTLTEQLWGSLLIAQVVKAARGAKDDHAARKAVEQVLTDAYEPSGGVCGVPVRHGMFSHGARSTCDKPVVKDGRCENHYRSFRSIEWVRAHPDDRPWSEMGWGGAPAQTATVAPDGSGIAGPSLTPPVDPNESQREWSTRMSDLRRMP